MRIFRGSVLSFAIAAGVVTTARAHGFGGAGIDVHSLIGADQALGVLALAVWSAQLGGAALWLMPATLFAAMLAGVTAASAGAVPWCVGATMAGAAVLAAGAVAMEWRVGRWAVIPCAAWAGLATGCAEGADVAHGADFGRLLIISAGIHALGVTAALLAIEHPKGRTGVRWSGAATGGLAFALMVLR